MGDPLATYDGCDSPERLLEAYLGGDADAFARIVALYEDRLYAYLARFTGDGHMAEDVFQQVFIKVAINAGGFDGRASFSTWLYRIARNQAIDELRRQRRHLAAEPLEGGRPEAAGDAEQPLERLTREELGARIRTALSTLPEPQRETFLLKEEGDFSFEEIGSIMNCSRDTAKSRFRLAVVKLRDLLGTA